ncbi:MAG: DUF2975 domain-containing protein [Sphingobacteriaceae bacterium]|nr:MAG: DUF2975 domain-containing protein [Sphingobacteriaceae bacterium]
MQITTKHVLKVLHVLAWIIFIGLSLQAGIVIVSSVLKFIISPQHHDKLWQEINFTSLYNFNQSYFITHIIVISIVLILKATLFYMIIKMFNDKKLSLSQPFSHHMNRYIYKMVFISFLIALFAGGGVNFSEWLTKQGVIMPAIQVQGIDGSDVWLLMSIVLFVLSQIFKRGIEIQSENELTV